MYIISKLIPKKSDFLRKEDKFLGHTLTKKGIKPNDEIISIVKKKPLPKTQKEIKSFLRLLEYYRKCISDLAKITKPLTKCLKKGSNISHTPEFIQAF